MILYAGDKIPFTLTVQDLQGNPIDISGKTVKFRFKCGDAAAQEKDAAIIDGPNGKARYTAQATDLVAGDMWREWMVDDISGPVPRKKAEVVARLA